MSKRKVLRKYSSKEFLKLYILLRCINRYGTVYGLEVLKYIRSFSETWIPSHGPFYPLIDEMVEEGLLERLPIIDKRKYVLITTKGIEYFNSRSEDFKESLIDSVNFYTTVIKEIEMLEVPINDM